MIHKPLEHQLILDLALRMTPDEIVLSDFITFISQEYDLDFYTLKLMVDFFIDAFNNICENAFEHAEKLFKEKLKVGSISSSNIDTLINSSMQDKEKELKVSTEDFLIVCRWVRLCAALQVVTELEFSEKWASVFSLKEKEALLAMYLGEFVKIGPKL